MGEGWDAEDWEPEKWLLLAQGLRIFSAGSAICVLGLLAIQFGTNTKQFSWFVLSIVLAVSGFLCNCGGASRFIKAPASSRIPLLAKAWICVSVAYFFLQSTVIGHLLTAVESGLSMAVAYRVGSMLDNPNLNRKVAVGLGLVGMVLLAQLLVPDSQLAYLVTALVCVLRVDVYLQAAHLIREGVESGDLV
jgi:hypothetical protein